MKNVKSKDVILTIFTPAYNRAHTITRTYESLCKQNCKDFIWLIVDDGSTDNTAALVKSWQEIDNGFEIRYVYKKNGGMHTAHNVAYENIDTEINTCIDSDDELSENAAQKIINKWLEIRDKGYAGIIALDAKLGTEEVIGKGFPDGLTETTVSGYYNNGGFGDKKLIYRTDIIKKYPEYPVFEGEKYVSLSYKYLLIDQDYKLAVLNEIVCNVEYQPDGSTNSMFRLYVNNPNGWVFWRKVRMKYDVSFKRLFVDAMHYVSSCKLAGKKHIINDSPKKIATLLAYPFGILLCQYVKNKSKR